MAAYIIRAGEHGPVKIGRTDDVHARLADLQASHHELLVLLRVIDTPFDAEPILHRRFSHLRLRGEWFSFDEEMLTFIPVEPKAEAEPPLMEIIKAARRAAIAETQDLCEEIWQHFRGIDNRRQFVKRLASLIGLTPGRAKKIVYGEKLRIEVHEMEGLRALARKLKTEERARAALARIGRPLPLFPDHKDEEEGR